MNSDLDILDRDEEGYLYHPDDWTAKIATQLAKEEALDLNKEHWTVLHYIRDYHAEHSITPDVRHLVRYLADQKGCDKKQAKVLVFDLFPYGYVRQACKIAGMMHLRAWSTG